MIGTANVLYSDALPNNSCHCRTIKYLFMIILHNILRMLDFNIPSVKINIDFDSCVKGECVYCYLALKLICFHNFILTIWSMLVNYYIK